MKRKTIQLAGRTLVLSLPSKWVKELGIEKGDELEVQTNKDSLVISCSSNPVPKKIKIDISNVNYSIAWHYIISAYCKGFDEFEIVFDKSTIKDNKNNKTVKTTDAVLQIIDSLIGMEIVRQGKNFCVVKEVSKTQKQEFPNILRRLFLLVLSIAEDSYDAINSKDKSALQNILLLEKNVNKFSHYSLRTLSKFFEKKDFAFIIRALELISDKYCFMIKNTKFSKKELELLKQSNLILRQFYETFYNLKSLNLKEFHTSVTNFKKSLGSQYLFRDIVELEMEILNANLFLEKGAE